MKLTELLEQPSLTEEQRLDYAGKIDTQVTRVTWLIRHLLTLCEYYQVPTDYFLGKTDKKEGSS